MIFCEMAGYVPGLPLIVFVEKSLAEARAEWGTPLNINA